MKIFLIYVKSYFIYSNYRRKRIPITGDNCCYCYLAGIKSLSDISTDDILYASFKNYLCEVGTQ